ncbi:MAG: energy transducer TonB [Desulfobacteraceae bacterium]|jgi:protein TonB
MKRILPAVLLAILFHAALFALDPGMLVKKSGKIQKPAVTVTMSYRKKPAPPPPVKKPPEIKKKKKVKVVKKDRAPAPVKEKMSVPEPEPIKEQEIVEEDIEIEEEYVESEQVEDTEVHEDGVDGSILIVLREAVPLYRANPAPKYPRMARKKGYQGTVLLSVYVNKEGKVDDLWLFESSGYKILDNAALKAVKDWLFEPGRRGDKAVDMWVEVPVKFELE